jgi:V-type H+-transporting ATPase subunit a
MLVPKPLIEVIMHYTGRDHHGKKKEGRALEPKEESREDILPIQSGNKSMNSSALA